MFAALALFPNKRIPAMTTNNPSVSFNRSTSRKIFLGGVPLIIAFSYGFLASQADLRLSIAALAGASALIMLLLSVALYLGETKGLGWSPTIIILFAIAFRLMFLFRLPELSDDIYRYLWDGLMILHGHNPYSFAPSGAKILSVEFAELLGHVNHPHLITIYPPAAQILFAVGAPGGILGIKLLFFVMDIAVCAIILRILLRKKMPASRAVLYAWHPLPILEIAGSGHIDGAAIFFLMLAFMLLLAASKVPNINTQNAWLTPTAAGIAFSGAMWVKLFPLVFLPAFLFIAGSKGRLTFMLGAVVGAIALSIPFLPGLYNMFTTLDIYVHNWEFAGFVFQSLRNIFSSGSMARQVLVALFLVITTVLYASLLRIQSAAKGAHGLSFFAPVVETAYCITLAFLLLTPTLHPWYALYLACLLPFVPGAAGLVMTWAVLLSYRVLISFTLLGTWEENGAITTVIWAATAGAAVLSWLARGSRLDFQYADELHHDDEMPVKYSDSQT
jgi:hypothetical protein